MSIQGYAEAIKDGVVKDEELEESLEIIITESQRLKKIVEELIFLTKLENVDDTFSYTNQEIGELMQKVIKSLRSLAIEKDISFKISGDLKYRGSFDGEKLQRAFFNILENGIRYAKSEISVDINNKGTYLEIEVSDDGPGFQVGEEKKVLERFYKGNGGVTGLGLAIAKAIIQGHRGTIEAYNGTKGAVFRITLPHTPVHFT